jgi:Ca-activated chloride channel homolog
VSRSLALVSMIGIAATVALRAQMPGAAPPTAVASSAPAAPTFRGGVDLVALTVTVTDPRRQFIRDLKAADFAVLEDGVPQAVSFFGADEVPLDLAVVVDCSASMIEKLPAVQRAAIGLVQSLRTGDRAAVIEFRSSIQVQAPMTTDRAAVVHAIEGLHAEGDTGLYTAVYVTLREMGREKASDVRRQAIVLLSDGEDTNSLVPFDDVLDLAKRTGISVYTIGLTTLADRVLRRRTMAEGEYAMQTLADATGARAFFPEGENDVRAVYGAIAAELGSQYSIGYLPRVAIGDGRWRQVAVRVTDRPGASARARLGYFASPSLAALKALLKH